MKLQVVNKMIAVGAIRVIGVAASSVLLIGDTRIINCSNIAESLPETVSVGPIVPLPPARADLT